MSLPAADLQELQSTLADRLYIQVSGWHLYLGDAGLAQPLAIECSALMDQGPRWPPENPWRPWRFPSLVEPASCRSRA